MSLCSCRLLEVFNQVLTNKKHSSLLELTASSRLREDVGFDSLDLAELTVRIEEKFGVDVFADGVVTTVGEVLQKVEKAGRT